MKPPPFDYYDPRTVAEVLALLSEYGDDAKLLAGGQSLMPVLNMRLARPRVIIDLNRVDELAYMRVDGEHLVIGAMTRHATVERSPLVAERQPLLLDAVRHIGHRQIRNRGTIGGSLAHADPAAELPAVMVALGATLRITGPGSTRDVTAADFFVMYFTTVMQPDELLTEVRVPLLPPRTGHAFVELARRSGDFALVAVACTLTLAPDGLIADVRLALQGVGMTPVRPVEAEQMLKGGTPTSQRFAHAAAAVAAGITPDSDVHATAAYRTQLAAVLTQRALEQAALRAQALAEGGATA